MYVLMGLNWTKCNVVGLMHQYDWIVMLKFGFGVMY